MLGYDVATIVVPRRYLLVDHHQRYIQVTLAPVDMLQTRLDYPLVLNPCETKKESLVVATYPLTEVKKSCLSFRRLFELFYCCLI